MLDRPKNPASATFTKDNWNPLLWASCNGDEDMVRLLIKYQAHAQYQKSFKSDDSQREQQSQNSEENADPFVPPPDS